ncbi:MAG: hypothetical protein Q4D89_04715 [Arachnia propionica]|uniref:hypothetical protein n=1 Tax=Arachnia propionica TaxID=1750 RepID=UPI0026FE1DE0|nr:hypothetical protein [Arachnia propionica]
MPDPAPEFNTDALRQRAAQGKSVHEFIVTDAQLSGITPTESAARWAAEVELPREVWGEAAVGLLSAELSPEEQRDHSDDFFAAAVDTMRDDTAPAWVRVGLALQQLPAARTYYPAIASDPLHPDACLATDLLDRWDEAEHAVWSAEQWPGIDLDDPQARHWFEVQTRLAPGQLEWCRRQFHDPGIKGVALGLCLRRVMDADALTTEDLDVLVDGWQDRFLTQLAGETYSCVPAVVALGIALAELGHPARSSFDAHIRTHFPAWDDLVQVPLLGWYGTTEDLEPLWEEMTVTGADHRTCLGVTVGRARLVNAPVATLCDQAAGVNPKLLRTLVQIAIAFGGRPRLWCGLANPHSLAWRRRAAVVANDAGLSEEFRAEARRFT